MAISYNSKAASDAAAASRALAADAERVFVALLGEPTSKSRREYRWRTHGSLAGCLAPPKRGLWNDFESGEGGDLLHLVARECGVGLGEAIRIAKRDYLGGMSTPPAQPRSTPSTSLAADGDAEARAGAALRIWGETVPLAGTPAERYLVGHRRLDIGRLALDHALRWHPGIGAVAALMTDAVSGEAIGVHRTFIDAEGAKLERKMLGRQGVIRLSPDDAVTTGLGITEGIEDGLAVLLSGWAPLWVATSAGAIARFPVLAGSEALTVFADADTPGLQAAESCAARWRAAGREARITSPSEARP
jgi:putative DNA primase/helicase